MRGVVLFLAMAAATGCDTLSSEEFWSGEPEPTKAELCQSYGFEFGTGGYGECMLRLVEIDHQRRQARLDYRRSRPIIIPRLEMPPSRPPGSQSQTTCHTIGDTLSCNTFTR